MLETTLKIMRSGLEADPSLTPADRARLMATLRNGGTPQSKTAAATPNAGPKILRRKQAAKLYECSVRLIDRLAQQGFLKKVRLPGRTRAAGFLESDIEALITTTPNSIPKARALNGGTKKRKPRSVAAPAAPSEPAE
jgi:predicted DNA-binding transcriptional regulator AlpA